MVALDKTGTLTTGEPVVAGVAVANLGTNENENDRTAVLRLAAAVEAATPAHPVAVAIAKAFDAECGEKLPKVCHWVV